MKRMFIEPLDVLMFRDERPFTAREAHVATTIDFISPFTFEGAIKAKILAEFCTKNGYKLYDFYVGRSSNCEDKINELKLKTENNQKLKDILELIGYTPLDFNSKLNVIGVFLSNKNNEKEYLPVPKDIVSIDTDNKLTKLAPTKIDDETYILLSKESIKIKEINGRINLEYLRKYLWNDQINIENIENNNVYYKEVRTGIELDKAKRVSIDGALYVAEYLRLEEGWGFMVWCNYDISKFINDNENLIRLGGEGKGALLKVCNNIDLAKEFDFNSLIETINKEKRFKLYLATPSYFNGYRPPEDKLKNKLGVTKLKLIAALPGKPLYIGGYDFTKNKEKPLRRWVGAGAVYYYEFEGELNLNELVLPLSIIEKDIDMRCAFIGRW